LRHACAVITVVLKLICTRYSSINYIEDEGDWYTHYYCHYTVVLEARREGDRAPAAALQATGGAALAGDA
jgi:hypothetical protein